MKKKILLMKPVWGVCLALVLSACGQEKMPKPLTFTPLTGTKGDILQAVLDHHLDNYFHNIEKESGVQGKVSFVDAQTRTNTTRLDKIVRFEHPKLCNKGECPFVLLWQKESYTSEIDRWELNMMAMGSSFSVGRNVHQYKRDLFIMNNVLKPRYYWDNSTDMPQYDIDYNFRVKAP